MATRKTKAGDPRKRRQAKGKAAASGALTTVVAVIVAIAYFINGDLPGESGFTGSSSISGTAEEYRATLSELEVRGRAPMTGYDRDFFGTAWTDAVEVEFGNNGCDTRNDILRRDLSALQVREGTRDCLIEKGTLEDPFSGESIKFVRGQSTSGAVQIDTWCPWLTPGRRAPSSGMNRPARISPMILTTSSRSREASTVRRVPATQPPGCPRTGPSVVITQRSSSP